jgi:hypothetical protein
MQVESQQRTTGPDGRQQLKLVVKSLIGEMAGDGELDQSLSPYAFGRATTI